MGWFGGSNDVGELVARRKFDRAIEVLEQQLEGQPHDLHLRKQLGDVLILAGRDLEAVPLLRELADAHASQGEAGKAIALLKKIERIQPGRSDVESRLARLIKGKGKPSAATRGGAYQPREGLSAEGYEPAGALFSAEHFEQQAEAPPSHEERIEAARRATWVPSTRADETSPEPLPAVPPPQEPEPLARGQILESIEEVMKDPAQAAVVAPSQPAVVATPLFEGFSQEELLAVMHGLRLLVFEPGDIIITEGDAGDSLFILTTGTVKAFVKLADRSGQRLLRTMSDGSFFGEISILSGKPRTATVTAATACELLELDRATLEEIKRDHPRVQKVLEDFYIQRAAGD